jgi:hypothetical protein
MKAAGSIQCQPDPAAPPTMLLNAFDVDPGAAERTLEIQCGELFELGISADLLVVSAWQGVYEPVPGTLVERLEQACGLRLGLLPRALDLTGSAIGAWVSPPLRELPHPPAWPGNSATRFQRLAVVESPRQGTDGDPWPVFNQLFCLLALLPLQNIHCPVVATPLLSAGNQRVAPERLFHHLLERCRTGFRHVPDLERLIVFDRQRSALEQLADRIDLELGRHSGEREQVALSPADTPVQELQGVLRGFCSRHPQLRVEADVNELSHLLASGSTTAIALGMHGRRLVEHLVLQRLGWRRGTLYQGIQALNRMDLDPWLISCLHQVRVFGNWMGHPSHSGRSRAVNRSDLTAMLSALLRVLEDYPW